MLPQPGLRVGAEMPFPFAFGDDAPVFQSETLFHFKTILLSDLKEILKHRSIFQRD